MTKEEYEELKDILLGKRFSIRCGGKVTNYEAGYDDGILTAVSKIREVYQRKNRK